MPSKKKKKDRRAAEAHGIAEATVEPGSRTARAGLAGILVLAAVLRCLWLDSSLGGFHSFNEAHYTLIAKNYFHGSPLFPTPDGRYLFLETPPLYSYLLHAIFRLTGVSVLAGRLLSVTSSLALVAAVFFFTRRLFNESAALIAALILAVTPVAVLTGRNIQTDSTLLVFVVAALFFSWRAEEERSSADRLRSGVFAGLALFTKLFAAIAFAAVILWELATKRTLSWLEDGARWKAAALALLFPGLFYGYQAARDFGYLRRDVAGGAVAATPFPRTGAEWGAIGAEAWWAFSPLIALLLAAGVVAALPALSRVILFVLLPLSGFALFYLFVHKHSYYLLTVLPFAAALAGRLVSRFSSRALRLACAGATALSGSFWSLVDVTSMKSGFTEFEQFGRAAAQLAAADHVLVIDREMADSYLPVIRFYDPKARITVIEDAAVEEGGRLRLPRENVFLLKFVPPQTPAPPAGALLTRTRYGLGLPGRTILEAHPNPHFFRQGRYFAEKADAFGFSRREFRVYPALALLPVPPELALYRTPRGLEARPFP
jgi:4-amino-4-deoxy-L-arabinose transferase-like glycosyltransferase